ncbi:MAG: putative toxin-antitoxin system toxin component, PIN family [Chloroflexi bacterium]|nr:putative toxin-antitoxin system toxin component, PIN family [Chloroflexota bacterium]
MSFVVQAFKRRLFLLLTSRSHMEEVFHTLGYPRLRRKYALSDRTCKRIVGQISARGLILSPTGSLEICRDPDDNYLIELALLGRADYLVTEDADLYDDPAVIRFLAERDTRVVRVEEFARVLREAPQPGG